MGSEELANGERDPLLEATKIAESPSYEFAGQWSELQTTGKTPGLLDFLTRADYQLMVYLTALALIVRLAFLAHPSVVIFDEVHFGGFAQKYLTGTFFNDLHPPLARLLVTLSAWVGGFDKTFNFYDIGADYIKAKAPYMTMRAFTATLGALTVPVAYITMRGMRLSRLTSACVSLMVLFDNGLATQSRYILLDSYLVFSTTLVALFWILLRHQRKNAFSIAWYQALAGLGTSIALAASCKWVGLFAVIAVGLYTALDLWDTLGNVNVPLRDVAKHLLARVVMLILLPFAIYAAFFWVHFRLLRYHTAFANAFTLEFQHSLLGGRLPETPRDLYYGATVRLRQVRPEGVYLHSHAELYPEGSKQQQVTGYAHRDQNNLWIIRRAYVANQTYSEGWKDELAPEAPLTRLKHRDGIRLQHVQTGRFLHSHPVDPPVSDKEKQHEISCYGNHAGNFSDGNDNWRIEIVNADGTDYFAEDDAQSLVSPSPIEALTSKFRLVHSNIGCLVHCRNKALPDWGFKQAEVTCGKETLRSNAVWMIESNDHPRMPANTTKSRIAAKGFWGKFWELNLMMWRTNSGLPTDHPFGSRPESWPFLLRGLGFWNGGHVPKTPREHADEHNNVKREKREEKDMTEGDRIDAAEKKRLTELYQQKFRNQQVYLLGNPLVWWMSTASLGIYLTLVVLYRIVKQREMRLATILEGSAIGGELTLNSISGFMFVQWVWHYLPFFGMQRQLFLHHYLPALYFSILLMAKILEAGQELVVALTRLVYPLSVKKGKQVRYCIMAGLVVATVWIFIRFAPLGYGLGLGKSQCNSLKWLPRWDFDCDSLSDVALAAVVTS